MKTSQMAAITTKGVLEKHLYFQPWYLHGYLEFNLDSCTGSKLSKSRCR